MKQAELFEPVRPDGHVADVYLRVEHVHVKQSVARGWSGRRSGPNNSTREVDYEMTQIDEIDVLLQIVGPSDTLKGLGAPTMYGQLRLGAKVKRDVWHPFRALVPGSKASFSLVEYT